MADKIRYGLANVKYALWNESSNPAAYGSLKSWQGAVALTLSLEGGDGTDFYADDGVYYSFAGTNGGYTAELEMARITDTVRADLLGEVADSTVGAQFEFADAQPAEFAFICEMKTDGMDEPVAFCFYGCKASRVELKANTQGESPDVDTDTISIRISGRAFTVSGTTRTAIQSHIRKTSTNATKYTAFLAAIPLPTSGSVSA